MHDLHATAATTKGGLDGHGPADGISKFDDLVRALESLGTTRNTRDPGLFGGEARGNLVTHDFNRRGRRSNEGHPTLGDSARKVRVLGEEAVAGVDGIGATSRNDVQDGLGVEVALRGALASEGVSLVGEAHVQRVTVEFGVHRHGGDAHFSTRADDADGNLSAVSDQNLGNHVDSCERVQTFLAPQPSNSKVAA